MGAQVPRRIHAEVPQEGAVWANQAALGPGGGDRVSEGEKARSGLRRMWNASCAIFLVTNSGREATSFRPSGGDEETIRAYIKNQEIADKQLDQLQLKLASS